jgi:hypothetical protein
VDHKKKTGRNPPPRQMPMLNETTAKAANEQHAKHPILAEAPPQAREKDQW